MQSSEPHDPAQGGSRSPSPNGTFKMAGGCPHSNDSDLIPAKNGSNAPSSKWELQVSALAPVEDATAEEVAKTLGLGEELHCVDHTPCDDMPVEDDLAAQVKSRRGGFLATAESGEVQGKVVARAPTAMKGSAHGVVQAGRQAVSMQQISMANGKQELGAESGTKSRDLPTVQQDDSRTKNDTQVTEGSKIQKDTAPRRTLISWNAWREPKEDAEQISERSALNDRESIARTTHFASKVIPRSEVSRLDKNDGQRQSQSPYNVHHSRASIDEASINVPPEKQYSSSQHVGGKSPVKRLRTHASRESNGWSGGAPSARQHASSEQPHLRPRGFPPPSGGASRPRSPLSPPLGALRPQRPAVASRPVPGGPAPHPDSPHAQGERPRSVSHARHAQPGPPRNFRADLERYPRERSRVAPVSEGVRPPSFVYRGDIRASERRGGYMEAVPLLVQKDPGPVEDMRHSNQRFAEDRDLQGLRHSLRETLSDARSVRPRRSTQESGYGGENISRHPVPPPLPPIIRSSQPRPRSIERGPPSAQHLAYPREFSPPPAKRGRSDEFEGVRYRGRPGATLRYTPPRMSANLDFEDYVPNDRHPPRGGLPPQKAPSGLPLQSGPRLPRGLPGPSKDDSTPIRTARESSHAFDFRASDFAAHRGRIPHNKEFSLPMNSARRDFDKASGPVQQDFAERQSFPRGVGQTAVEKRDVCRPSLAGGQDIPSLKMRPRPQFDDVTRYRRSPPHGHMHHERPELFKEGRHPYDGGGRSIREAENARGLRMPQTTNSYGMSSGNDQGHARDRKEINAGWRSDAGRELRSQMRAASPPPAHRQVPQRPAAPPRAPPPPLNCREEDKVWYYIDPQGKTQGPCSILQFRGWLKYLGSEPNYEQEYKQFVSVKVWREGTTRQLPLLLLLEQAQVHSSR